MTYLHTLTGQLGHVSITTPNLNINLEPHPAVNLGIIIMKAKGYVNGKPIEYLTWRQAWLSIKKMEEKGEIEWYNIADTDNLASDFCEVSAVIPLPVPTIVTDKPIKTWESNREIQWYMQIKDEHNGQFYYFTGIDE